MRAIAHLACGLGPELVERILLSLVAPPVGSSTSRLATYNTSSASRSSSALNCAATGPPASPSVAGVRRPADMNSCSIDSPWRGGTDREVRRPDRLGLGHQCIGIDLYSANFLIISRRLTPSGKRTRDCRELTSQRYRQRYVSVTVERSAPLYPTAAQPPDGAQETSATSTSKRSARRRQGRDATSSRAISASGTGFVASLLATRRWDHAWRPPCAPSAREPLRRQRVPRSGRVGLQGPPAHDGAARRPVTPSRRRAENLSKAQHGSARWSQRSSPSHRSSAAAQPTGRRTDGGGPRAARGREVEFGKYTAVAIEPRERSTLDPWIRSATRTAPAPERAHRRSSGANRRSTRWTLRYSGYSPGATGAARC